MSNTRRGFMGGLLGAIGAAAAHAFGRTPASEAVTTVAASRKTTALASTGQRLPMPIMAGDVELEEATVIADAIMAKFGDYNGPASISIPFSTLPLSTMMPKLEGEDAAFAPVRPMLERGFANKMWMAGNVVDRIFKVSMQAALATAEHKTDWQVVDDAAMRSLPVPSFDATAYHGKIVDGNWVRTKPPAAAVLRVTSTRVVVDIEDRDRYTEAGMAKALLAIGRGMAAEICSRLAREPHCDWTVRTVPVQMYVKREAFMMEFFAWVNVSGWGEEPKA